MSDWIDAELAAVRSMRGWRARAVGMPLDQALAKIPRRGLLQTWLPIDAYRTLQMHIRARGLTQAAWFRRAVIATYLAEGGEPTVAATMDQIGRSHRSSTTWPRA